MSTSENSYMSRSLELVILGGNGGLVASFAIVAGFAGAYTSGGISSLVFILLFGLVSLLAGSLLLGLSNFFSAHSGKQAYEKQKKSLRLQITAKPEQMREETYKLLIEEGFAPHQANQVLDGLMQNKEFWTDFLLRYDLGLSPMEMTRPFISTVITIFSFAFLGFVPLIPFLFIEDVTIAFLSSIGSALFTLLLLGLLRWRVTGRSMLRCVLEIVLVSFVAIIPVFLVGTLFK